MVIGSTTNQMNNADPRVTKALSIGYRFWVQLNHNDPKMARDFAEIKGVDNRFVGRALQLAFLAPDIVEALANGRCPPEWTSERLLRQENLPLSWIEQRRLFETAQ